MVEQLQVFGSEVSRVAREVGTEGNLGGQAQISGVSGIWKELTENGMSPSLLLRYKMGSRTPNPVRTVQQAIRPFRPFLDSALELGKLC